jgi:hypothetical protein
MCRLRGEAFPASINELLNEGRQAVKSPGSLAEAHARIDATVGKKGTDLFIWVIFLF